MNTPFNDQVLSIKPSDVSVGAFHAWLLGSIAPRPIAFVSTADSEGNVNLAPFSFFNVFGSNPPLLIFSPATRVRNGTNKHTLENAESINELVVNMVNYPIVEQMSLASCEYDKGVNEFVKAGFTEAPSLYVKPPRVAESPAAFECKVLDIITYGKGGGAANLVICEVLVAHFRKEYLDENQKLNIPSLDLVGRMGADWYVRANANSLFEVPKPNEKKGIGFDNLPESIKNSKVLTGNNLARLANIEAIPEYDPKQEDKIKELLNNFTRNGHGADFDIQVHLLAKQLILDGEINLAWQLLTKKL